jgi:hypothetical protein
LKCGAGKGWGSSDGPIVRNDGVLHRMVEWSRVAKELPSKTHYLRKDKKKLWSVNEEDVSSYWMALREREDTGNRNR